MTVTVRSQWWIPVTACGSVPLLMLLLLFVPQEEAELGRGGILLFTLGAAAALGLILVVTYLVRGSDAFSADDDGVHLRSSKRDDEDIPWDELVELGWVTPTRYTRGGLAGRRVRGGDYEPGGPLIAGWLSQPTPALGLARALTDLEALCTRNGVAWRTYTPAEVV